MSHQMSQFSMRFLLVCLRVLLGMYNVESWLGFQGYSGSLRILNGGSSFDLLYILMILKSIQMYVS